MWNLFADKHQKVAAPHQRQPTQADADVRAELDTLHAQMLSVRASQANTGEMLIEIENRQAKQDALHGVQAQRFAGAIDQLDARSQELRGDAVQVLGRLGDVSALGQRVNDDLTRLREQLSRIETLALEIGLTDGKLEAFRADVMQAISNLIAGIDARVVASEANASHIATLTGAVERLTDATVAIAGNVSELMQLAGIVRELPPAYPNGDAAPPVIVPKFEELLAKEPPVNVEELRAFYARKMAEQAAREAAAKQQEQSPSPEQSQ